MARVVVGLSGGVDSSVAAHLLKEQGHEVIALFMRNWNDDSVILDDECPWIEDSNDAILVAEKLGIPFQVIDMSADYKERIVDYMFSEYEAGRTPNPDVLCNREIKFDLFLDTALSLGADYVATGHYCQKDEVKDGNNTYYRLLAGADKNKDQSYFLCQLTQYQLSKALFPIGAMEKSEVRKLATELDLVTADKKDSQGLCFIGKVSLPTFLQQKLKSIPGDVYEIERDDLAILEHSRAEPSLGNRAKPYNFNTNSKKLLGQHSGAHFFTIGQRKGLKIGGSKEPLFVLATDIEQNIIYTGQREDHPGLSKEVLLIDNDEIHWIRTDFELNDGESKKYKVRIRYRQALVDAELFKTAEGLYISFAEPMKAITPGQFAAWYLDNELIGSGVIKY